MVRHADVLRRGAHANSGGLIPHVGGTSWALHRRQPTRVMISCRSLLRRRLSHGEKGVIGVAKVQSLVFLERIGLLFQTVASLIVLHRWRSVCPTTGNDEVVWPEGLLPGVWKESVALQRDISIKMGADEACEQSDIWVPRPIDSTTETAIEDGNSATRPRGRHHPPEGVPPSGDDRHCHGADCAVELPLEWHLRGIHARELNVAPSPLPEKFLCARKHGARIIHPDDSALLPNSSLQVGEIAAPPARHVEDRIALLQMEALDRLRAEPRLESSEPREGDEPV